MFGINQSKNASSSATNLSNTDSNNDNSYGSHNTDNSQQGGVSTKFDSSYDNHGTVKAGDNSTVTVTDGGAVQGAYDTVKALAADLLGAVSLAPKGGVGPHETAYDGAAVSSSSGVSKWVWIGGAAALAVGVVVVVIAMRRK